jgi:hypothetical protein
MKKIYFVFLSLIAFFLMNSRIYAQIDREETIDPIPNDTNLKQEEAPEEIEEIIDTISKDIYYKKAEVPKIEVLTENDIKNRNFPGFCYSIREGYSDEIWLYPPVEVSDYYKRISGLSSFDPRISYLLTKLKVAEINSITPKVFIAGVQRGELLLYESVTSGIRYYSIPELDERIKLLSKKDILEIASERDKFISEIIQIREKYIKTNMTFLTTKFEISGKCYANKSNYDVNSQQIDLHVSINYGKEEGIYIATIRIPLVLSDASEFFSFADEFTFPISFLVSVGANRKSLGISGGGVSRWVMPNFTILENPTIAVSFPNGKSYQFKTSGFKGDLWNPSINTSRWDLNNVDRPFHGYSFNTRLIRGIKL